MFKSVFNSARSLKYHIRTKCKEVIIVRGVPGVGKDNYVYSKEQNKKEHFAVCCVDNYFMKGNKYQFDRKDVAKAEACTLEHFHMNLKFGVPRIYVTNVNSQKWMYLNYITLANSYGYKVKIVELEFIVLNLISLKKI